MKTLIIVISLFLSFCGLGRSETVEMRAGPIVRISYDPGVWKPLASLRPPEPGGFQSMTWKLQAQDKFQVTVASHPERITESERKSAVLDRQKLRGDPADLIRELRQSIGNRDWSILEFRNGRTRPPRSETHYFSASPDGYVTFFVIGDEAILPKHREAIEAFLRQVEVK